MPNYKEVEKRGEDGDEMKNDEPSGTSNLRLTPNQLTVLLFFFGEKARTFTTHEVAEGTKLSWRTTSAALDVLLKKNIVKRKVLKDGKIVRWMLTDYEKLVQLVK